jgi:hypothetical protein
LNDISNLLHFFWLRTGRANDTVGHRVTLSPGNRKPPPHARAMAVFCHYRDYRTLPESERRAKSFRGSRGKPLIRRRRGRDVHSLNCAHCAKVEWLVIF